MIANRAGAIGAAIETAPKSLLGRTRAIEHSQPMLSLHGHIHESAGAVKVGPVVAINPGSECGEGLRGVLVTLADRKKGQGRPAGLRVVEPPTGPPV